MKNKNYKFWSSVKDRIAQAKSFYLMKIKRILQRESFFFSLCDSSTFKIAVPFMHWETLQWMVIKNLSKSNVLSSLCGSGSSKRNRRGWNILGVQEGCPVSPPLQSPAISDSSRSNTFSNLKRERFHSYAENMLSLLVEKKFWEAECRAQRW